MKRSHRALSLVLALSTFAATPMGLGCAANTSSEEDGEATTAAAISSNGEAHFTGILFGTGVVARALPEVWRNTEQMNQAVTSLTSASVAADLEGFASTLQPAAARLVNEKATLIRQGKISEASLRQQAHTALANPAARAHVDKLIAGINARDSKFFDRFRADMQSGDRTRIQGALRNAQDILQKVIGDQMPKPGPRNPGDPGPESDVVVDTDVAIYVEVAIAVAVAAVVVVVVERPGDLGARLRQEVLVNAIAGKLAGVRGGGMR